MPNTLTGLIPTIYESLDVVSRELTALVGGVTADTNVARAAVGQTVLSTAAPASSASDITPGVTAPNDGDQIILNRPITITKARAVPIRWNGEEQRGLNSGGPGTARLLRDQFAQAMRTLVNEIETDIVATARVGASRAVGTAGTAPFGTVNDLSDFAGVLQILADNGAPSSALQLALASSAIFNLRGRQAVLFRANEAGTDMLLRDGIIGRVQGLNVRESAQIRAVARGTGSGYTTNAAGYAVGATAITVTTGTGTVLAGDTVTFAGDTNRYVVATGIAAAGTLVLAAPGLRQAIPTSATAVTVGANYTPNIAYAKTAIVLATRAPALPIRPDGTPMDMANDRMTVTDPNSGISFEVSEYLQYRQVRYEVAIAWGQSVIKPEHVGLLLG